jgi:hypothetical protein
MEDEMTRGNNKDSRIAPSRVSVQTCLTVMIILIASGASGQQATSQEEIYEIELKDGSLVLGVILSEDGSSIHFRTLSQVDMRILKEMIVEKTKISGEIVKGELWRDDPNSTRLLFSPTGRALKAGQGYFSVYEVFFPFVAVGITDFLAVAGGMTLIPGMESQAFYIAPKITPLQLKNFDFSLGALYARVPDEDEGAGIIYGVGTAGSAKASLTVGAGFGFMGADFADKPILMIGGETQISPTVKMLSENWIIPDSDVQLFSLGIRFFGSKLAADFGLIYPAGGDSSGWPLFPWIGFAYNFGNR